MKQSVSPKIVISIIVVVVLVIGFFAYKTFFPNTEASPSSPEAVKEFNQTRENSAIKKQMQGGGGQRGAYGGGGQ